jgi:predicted methyltransferase
MAEMEKHGMIARGIESSRYIYDQASADMKKKIAFGDAVSIVKKIPDNSYDLVHDTVAQYVAKDTLKSYLAELCRICVKDLVIVLHTVDLNPDPHQCQVNHLHDVTWRRLLKDAGFVEQGPIDDHPFYFKKANNG